jgi:hypothetical protein
MTFVAMMPRCKGDGGFPAIVPVADHNWASQTAESAAEQR